MTVKFTEEQTKFFRQEFNIVGRILFPNLLQLKKKDKPEDRDVYDVQFAWRPEQNPMVMAAINAYMQQAIPMAHQGINPAILIPPIKASKVQGYPEYLKQNGQPNPDYLAGHLWVNASTGKDHPPGVFKNIPGVGLVRLTEADAADVYSGRNAVICISFWPMIPDPTSRNQKRGFYVNVRAVLLQEGGDQLGGGSQVDPQAVFGSFMQDMQSAPAFGQYGQAPAAAPAIGPAGQPAGYGHAPAAHVPPMAPQGAPQWGQPAPQVQQPYAAPAPAPAWGQPAPAPAAPMAQPQWPPQSATHAAPAPAPYPGAPGPYAPNFNPGHGQY